MEIPGGEEVRGQSARRGGKSAPGFLLPPPTALPAALLESSGPQRVGRGAKGFPGHQDASFAISDGKHGRGKTSSPHSPAAAGKPQTGRKGAGVETQGEKKTWRRRVWCGLALAWGGPWYCLPLPALGATGPRVTEPLDGQKTPVLGWGFFTLPRRRK